MAFSLSVMSPVLVLIMVWVRMRLLYWSTLLMLIPVDCSRYLDIVSPAKTSYVFFDSFVQPVEDRPGFQV